MVAWASWIVAALALGSVAGGQMPLPMADGPSGPVVPSGDAILAASAQDASERIAAFIGRVEDATGQDAASDLASPGLRGLAALQPPQVPGTNATNQTVIPGYGNGTNTHYHGNVGDQGLGAVWASVFHGVPDIAIASDLDGDGTPDAILGTDLSVTAISGSTGDLMWARHLGSRVTSLFSFENDGQAGLEIGYSTLWEGQTPRIGVLDGRTGAVRWEHLGERPYLLAAPAKTDGSGPSDIVAADIDGVHTRLSAGTGEPLWQFDVDLLPDDVTDGVAPGTAYANLGQYLAEAADLNGDGTTDTVSVGLYMYGAGLNQYSLIHAVDGATGERLWVTNVGGDPHIISDGFVFDIDALDAQGDGSFDLAYSFLVFRVDALLPLAVYHYEQGWRVTKGDSTAVGVPIASHTVVTPMVAVETFPELDHTDIDGDGRHELAVLHELVTNALLGSDLVTYERYALPVGSTGDPTLLAVSDVVVGAGDAGRLTAFDLDGDGFNEHGVSRSVDGITTWTVVMDDGQVLGPFQTDTPVQAAAGLGERLAVASRGTLELRPADDLGSVTTSFLLRGAPRAMRLADLDQDGTQDIYILASDDSVHAIDGVTGIVASTLVFGEGIVDFEVADLGRGPEPDILLLRREVEQFGDLFLEGRDGGSGKVLFSTLDESGFNNYEPLPFVDGPLWFDGDGDGVRDVLLQDFFAIVPLDGVNGREMWNLQPDMNGSLTTTWDDAVAANVDGGAGDDILLSWRQGIVILDGAKGRTLGWHPIAPAPSTGSAPVTTSGSSERTVNCMGAADGDGDGAQTVFAIHSGSAGDLARFLDGTKWQVLDWVPDESQVARCDLRAVPSRDGSEDLLVSMAWVQGDGSVFARIGRWDVADAEWVWQDIQRRPDVESDAYFAFGVSGAAGGMGRVFLAWQDHAYSLAWGNGSLIGEFTVNGPFVMAGDALDLDGSEPAEAVILAADGIVWAVAEDRGLVAQRLAQKADDQGKDSNYGAGSSFEAPPPPPEKKAKKSFIPEPSLALVAAALVGAALVRARLGNR